MLTLLGAGQGQNGGQGLLLDNFSPSAIYSVRKLRTAYAGSCMRIRRSSDNAEQDIGFVNNVLDTASISSFVSTNSAFIVTWYDQSGNDRNLTQATTASQPRIVNAGTLDQMNSQPTTEYTGTLFLGASFADSAWMNKYGANTMFCIYQRKNAGVGNNSVWGNRQTTGTVGGKLLRTTLTTAAFITIGGATLTITPINNLNPILHVYRSEASSRQDVWINGANNQNSTDNTYTAVDTNGFNLGRSGVSEAFIGSISEFIGFESALSTTDRQTIENDQKTFYSIA